MGRSATLAKLPARAIHWCGSIPRPGARACCSAGAAIAISRVSRWRRASGGSTRYGSTPRSRVSPSGSNGARETSSCGTTAARCTGAMPSIRRCGACSTARRSSPPNKPAQRLDAIAVDAEVAPPEPRGRAHVHHALLLIVVKLHVIHVAHQLRAELGVQIVALGADHGGALDRLDGPPQVLPGAP